MLKICLRSILLAVLCCGVTFGVAAAQQQSMQSGSMSGHQLSPADRQFVEHLAKDSEGEVQLAQMVESKTNNPQVKEFAQRMVHDHTVLNQQVKQLMAKKDMTVPRPMTAEQQKLKTELEGMSGEQLDKTFMEEQVKDHEKGVMQIEQHAKNADQLKPPDPDVAELAEETLPVMREHLVLAKHVASEVGVAASAER